MMHRALEIQEIVAHIASFLIEDHGLTYGVDPALPRMARVCQSFWMPSASSLWRRIHNFLPLLSVTVRNGILRHSGRWDAEDISSCISESDWDRVLAYMRFVRVAELSLGTRDHRGTHPSAVELLELFQSRSPQPLFPALARLTIFDIPAPQLHWIFYIAPDTLASLDVHTPNNQLSSTPTAAVAISDCLRSIRQKLPSVAHLGFHGSDWYEGDGLELFAELFSSVPRLASFSMNAADNGVSPFIHKLGVSFSDIKALRFNVTSFEPMLPGAMLFPALRRLVLRGKVVEFLHILESLSAPSLDALVLEQTMGANDLRLQILGLSTAVADAAPSLTSFRLSFFKGTIKASDLLPLARCSSVRHIEIEGSPLKSVLRSDEVAWDKSDVLQLVTSWPLLRYFELSCDGSACLTLPIFSYFAEHCPHLDYLAADFDLREKKNDGLVGPPDPVFGYRVLRFGSFFQSSLDGEMRLAAQTILGWWPQADILLPRFAWRRAEYFKRYFQYLRDSGPY